MVQKEIQVTKQQILASDFTRRFNLKTCKNLKIRVMDAKDRHNEDVWQTVNREEDQGAKVLNTKVICKKLSVFSKLISTFTTFYYNTNLGTVIKEHCAHFVMYFFTQNKFSLILKKHFAQLTSTLLLFVCLFFVCVVFCHHIFL